MCRSECTPTSSLVWTRYPNKNCFWDGHGAGKEVESPRGSSTPGVTTLTQCKAACFDMYPKCEGVLFGVNGNCYRKADLSVDRCQTNSEFDLYALTPPSPPPSPPEPPSLPLPSRPPPVPPAWPASDCWHAGTTTARLNCEFDKGGSVASSSRLSAAGVFVSQFDVAHHPDKLWMPCQPQDWCHRLSNRFAGTVVNAHVYGTYNNYDGGIILTGSLVSVPCGYSYDASTTGRRLEDVDLSSERRDLAQYGMEGNFPCPRRGQGGGWCTPKRNEGWTRGFSNSASYPYGDGGCAWREQDMQWMMRQQYYMQGGASYNELVIDAPRYAEQLPASLAAIFYQKWSSEAERDRARAQHDAFLREHSGTTAAETPLLLYDPSQTPPFTCVRCS